MASIDWLLDGDGIERRGRDREIKKERKGVDDMKVAPTLPACLIAFQSRNRNLPGPDEDDGDMTNICWAKLGPTFQELIFSPL